MVRPIIRGKDVTNLERSLMERLFVDEVVPSSVDEVITDDVTIRISKIFDKYNFIEPKDLLSVITLVTSEQVDRHAKK